MGKGWEQGGKGDVIRALRKSLVSRFQTVTGTSHDFFRSDPSSYRSSGGSGSRQVDPVGPNGHGEVNTAMKQKSCPGRFALSAQSDGKVSQGGIRPIFFAQQEMGYTTPQRGGHPFFQLRLH